MQSLPSLCCQVSAPRVRFLSLWLESYYSYRADHHSHNSAIVTGRLAQLFPHLLHIEASSFTQPRDMAMLYYGRYDISHNYVVHMWGKNRRFVIARSEEMLRKYPCSCTLGDPRSWCKIMLHCITLQPWTMLNSFKNLSMCVHMQSLSQCDEYW